MFSYYTKIQVSYKCSAWADGQNEEWITFNQLTVSLDNSYFKMPCCRQISLVTAFSVFKRNMGGNEVDMFRFVDSQKHWSQLLNPTSGELWVVELMVLPFAQLLGSPAASTLILEAELTGEVWDGLLQFPWWGSEHRASKIRKSKLI